MRGPISTGPVPAVVVGGSLNGLGVVRSLAKGGIPVFVLETTRRSPAVWSRHCTHLRVPSLAGETLIDALAGVASGFDCRPVLLLTTDESVNAVSAARSRIAPLYRIDLPAAAMVEALADKGQFHALAEREGFAVPRSRTLSAATDLDRLEALEPPIVLKPADKTLVLAGTVERAVRADTVAQARAAAGRMLTRASSLIAQEWVEGADTDIFFTLFACDREAKLAGMFPGRKLVCWPPAVGSTAVCVAAPEAADELGRQTRRFIERVGYRGLGSLEFKRDARTGRYVIIEPTVGRTDWQEEIATLCGVNLPLLAYWTALRASLPPQHEGAFERYAWRAERQFAVPRALVTPGTRVIDGYFRWSDPLPGTYYYGYERLAVRAWRRAIRLKRRLSPQTAEAH